MELKTQESDESSSSAVNVGEKVSVLREVVGNLKKKRRIYKEPEGEMQHEEVSKKKFAPQSKKKIMWAVNMYCDWRRNRIQNSFVSGFCIEV